MVVAVVAVVIVLAVAFGLSQFRPNVPGSSSNAAGSSSEKKEGTGKVVLRVNDEEITDIEFAQFMENVPAEQRTFYTTPAGRRALSDELVKLKALEQEAKRLGVTDDPKVKQQIKMATSQITAARALEKLAEMNLDAKVKAEYEKEKGTAKSLRHILIAYAGGQAPAKGGAQAPPEAQAMQRAQAIAARLRGGADFARTAMTESDDEQSGQNGGSIGPVRQEGFPEDIWPVVSKLSPGQMSDPVKTQFGIHIFKVEQSSLEELDPMLRQKVRQATAEAEIKRLQEGAKVVRDPQFFPEGPQAPGAPPAGAPKSQG
ncbi:MAG: peptidyl-prolyl cis-trans isomerase [Acidobacteriota bacterium]|nr:peptidyl-prolyl cis-trans isomerase [Acidobacteriota bacterium]